MLNKILTGLFMLVILLFLHSEGRKAYLHYSEKENAEVFVLDTDNPEIELCCIQSVDPYAPALWCQYVKVDS